MLSRLIGLREVGADHHSLRTAQVHKRILNLRLSKARDVFSSHQAAVLCLDVDLAESKYMLSGGADSVITCFDVEYDGKQSKKFVYTPVFRIGKGEGHKYGVSNVQWYPRDTGLFFTGSFDGTVKLWDPNTQAPILQFNMEGKVYAMHFSPLASHNLIAVGTNDQKGRLLDIRTGNRTHTLIGHKDAIWSIKWFPNSDYLLATGSEDTTVRFWDVRKAGCLMNLDQHAVPETSKRMRLHQHQRASLVSAHNGTITGLCFTSDGRYLLTTGTDDNLRCWDTSTGMNTLTNYPSTRNFGGNSMQLSVSSDGKIVYCPCGSMIHSYDILTGELISKMQGHYDRVNCSTFHPTREELFSGGNDYQILVWTPAEDEQQYEKELQQFEDVDTWDD